MLKLNKSLVCPRFEFCVQACRPYQKGDIKQVGRVQVNHQVITRFQLTSLPEKTKDIETHDLGIEKPQGSPNRIL